MTLKGSGSGMSLFHVKLGFMGTKSGCLCEAGAIAGAKVRRAAQKSGWSRELCK